MALSSAGMAVLRPDTCVSTILEIPQSRPIRDMQRVTALFCGLLRAFGHVVRFTGQSAGNETRIDTDEITLSLANSNGSLAVRLDRKSKGVAKPAPLAESLLARLIRAACPVLQPTVIWWLDREKALPTDIWLSAFRPVPPRRVRPSMRSSGTPRPGKQGVPIWPNRPEDMQDRHKITTPSRLPSPEDETLRRYTEWRPVDHPPVKENRFQPEPLPRRLSSWTLTAATAALYPPVGASLVVLNLAKRANLRRNLHALTLTVVILALHQSGALASAVRAIGL